MIPFLLYLVTSISVSIQIYKHVIPYYAIISWILLVGAAILTLIKPRLATAPAFIATLIVWKPALEIIYTFILGATNSRDGLIFMAVSLIIALILVSLVPTLITTIMCIWINLIDRRLRYTPTWVFPRQPVSRRGLLLGLGIVFVFLASMFIVTRFFVGIKRVISFETIWEYGKETYHLTCDHPIVLTYVEYPNFQEEFCSDELTHYLESGGTNRTILQVEFTYDFGSVEQRVIKQIGEWQYVESTWDNSSFNGCGYKTLPPCDGVDPWDPPFFR